MNIAVTTLKPLQIYLNLSKSRGILPHLITAAAAMSLATNGVPPLATLAYTLLGGGCLAAAANIINSYLDRDIDKLMERTLRRPIPAGKANTTFTFALAAGTGLAGILILSICVNWYAAFLSVIALAYYVFPYTLWLKRRSYWSVIVGSGIGALPPIIGWVATGAAFSFIPILLAVIVILWTVPHFFALAVFRKNDYGRAGLKLLPQKGLGIWMCLSSGFLAAATFVLIPVAGLGWFYISVISLLNGGMLYLVIRSINTKTWQSAKRVYQYSLIYIASLFLTVIVTSAI